MKIYSITQDDRYKTLVDADQSEGLQDFATQLAYGETTLVPEKQIFQVVYNSDDIKKSELSDFFTFFRPVLVVSEKAYGALKFLQGFPRIKLLGPRTGDVAVFITELVSNAFDFEQSDYDRGEGGYVVYKAVLNISESHVREIFRIPENPQVLYVSQVFKDTVEALGLRGIAFKEVARSY